jgi:outer membrane receptor protein involved in Fe transport
MNPVSAFRSKSWYLAFCAALGTLCTGQSWSQPQSQDDVEFEPVLEEVFVTGTRIKRVDFEDAVPLTVIDRQEIELSGYATIRELMRSSVYNSFGSLRGQANMGQARSGAAFIDLRGLGPQNTLVLLNGRRFAPFPGAGADRQDLNQIPLDMVERIDILRDGASAIYGSDAVAGVVNVITRKDMRSLVATLQVEDPEVHGGESWQLSFTGGRGWDGGNVTFSLEHFQQEEIFQRDIPRLSDTSVFNEMTLWGFPATAVVTPTGKPLDYLWFADPRCPRKTGESEQFPNAFRADAWEWTAGAERLLDTFCSYNYAAHNTYLPNVERTSGYIDTRFDLTPDTHFIATARYSIHESESRMAGAPVTDPYPVYSAVNPNNPLWLLIGQTISDPVLAWYPPYGDETYSFTEDDLADVLVFMRTVPNGTRDRFSEHENASLYAGFEGENNWFGRSEWNLGLEYAYSDVRDDGFNYAYTPAIQDAIDDGSLDFFNVQGLDHETWLDNVYTAFEPVNASVYYYGKTDMWTVDGMLRFDAFEWDSGPVPLVLGFEYYDLAYSQGEDPLSQAGLIANSVGGQIIEDASRDVLTFYAETMLPLGNHLELNLAARYDDYSDFGNTTNPKISAAWRPHEDWLLRASWGTGFKAPDMISLYAPQDIVYVWAEDYVGCDTGVVDPCGTREYRAITGGNPELDAHESESWTAGAVWNATDRLGLELTLYDIEYTNRVGFIDVQEMFERERDGLSHSVVRNPDGTVDYVSSALLNLSGEHTRGVDFSATYSLKTEKAGFYDFTLEWTRVLEWEREVKEGEGFTKLLDWIGYPENRGRIMFSWSMDAFGVTWATHYTGAHGASEGSCWGQESDWVDAPCTGDSEPVVVEELWTHDLQLSWMAPWRGQFSIGARNLFDEDPPYHDCCREPIRPTYDRGSWWLYSAAGRIAYIRYRQEF